MWNMCSSCYGFLDTAWCSLLYKEMGMFADWEIEKTMMLFDSESRALQSPAPLTGP
jgi:hypothetical protein